MAAKGGFDITAISNYIDETSFELIAKSILETSAARQMNVRTGLQGNNVNIPLLDTDFIVVDGENCGFSPSGNTTVSVVPMSLANAKVNITQCVQTLRDTFFSQALAAGALGGGESIPFEQMLAEHFVKKLNNWNESFIFQGATIGSTTFSGLTDYLTVAQGTISGATAAAWTPSTAVDAAQVLYNALPDTAAMMDDLVLFLSPTNYRALQLGITQENYYHIPPGGEIVIPGTNVVCIPSAGLSGADANKKYLGPKSTLFLGTDLESDFETFKLWYSQDNDEVRGLMRWRVGVAVSEPNLWVAEL